MHYTSEGRLGIYVEIVRLPSKEDKIRSPRITELRISEFRKQTCLSRAPSLVISELSA
jgi:hypothetical protein